MDWNRVQQRSAQQGSFAGGFAQGVWEGGKGLVTGVADLAKTGYRAATDDAYREQVFAKATEVARATGRFGAQAARDPIGTGESVWDKTKAAAGQAKQAFVQARNAAQAEGRLNNFYGNLIGRGGFEIASALVPVTKIGLLGKASQGAAAMGKASRIASKVPAAQRLTKARSKLKAKPKAKVGSVQGCKAVSAEAPPRLKGVPPPQRITKNELADWYRKQGEYFHDPENLRSHLAGTDARKPILKQTLPPGTELIQYVRKNGEPGMYFARPGTPMSKLGLEEPPPRVMRRFVVKQPIEIVESTAGNLPKGHARGVGGSGGGQQLIFPKGWEKSVQIQTGGR